MSGGADKRDRERKHPGAKLLPSQNWLILHHDEVASFIASW